MQEVRHLIFSLLLLIEAFLIKFYLYSFAILIPIIFFVDAIISVILFSSFLLSFIYLFSIITIFELLGLKLYLNYTSLASYLFSVFFSISILIFLIRKKLDDSFLSQLMKSKISIRLTNVIVSIIFLFISLVLNLILIHDTFILIGSLANSVSLIFVQNIDISPLALISWISFPYLLSQIGNITPKNGIYLGDVIAVLKKSIINSSKINTNSSYKWVSTNSKFYLDLNSNKNYNIIILGTSGSGKSYLAKSIISRGKFSYLIFDIHGEYNITGAEVIKASKISINPLSLFGQSPRQRALEVSYMLKSIFNLGNLQTIELSNLLLEAYAEKGIYDDDENTWKNNPPTFRDVLLLMQRKKKIATSVQEISKIESLEPYISFLTSNTFLETSINIFDILQKNVIIDFSKITIPEVKYIIIETLLSSIQSYMYMLGQSLLRKIIVIDEAPFILSKESGEQLMERLFAESRKFGFGFILISQSVEYVKKLIPNTAYVLVLSMVEPNEMEYISKLLGGQDTELFKAIYNTLQRLDRGLIITRDILRDEIILVRSN